MEKIRGWTKGEFILCDKCKEEGSEPIQQASRYTIRRKGSVSYPEWITTYYCKHHADIVDPPEKRLERKKKKELERAKESQSDDRERDWYFVAGAHRYL